MPSASARSPSTAALIELRGVGKRYTTGASPTDGVPALVDIDLRVDEGEFVAVLGASGSGKSTLMNILGCLDRPSTGQYRLAGVAVDAMDGDALAAQRNRFIGFVFQQFNLLARTSACENVELPLVYAGVPAAQRRIRALQALARVGLADRVEHTAAQLSGGQQQRVAIARALVNEPKLILADEPTGALDSRTSEDVMGLLSELNTQGITIVLVTHEADVAAWARRRLVFRDGRLIEDVRQPGRSRSNRSPSGSSELHAVGEPGGRSP